MYENKTKQYFQNLRLPLLKLIPDKNKNGTVLEIGAASGKTLIYAKENGYAKSIYGIDIVKIENSFQQSDEFEDFTIGNVENLKFNYKENFFDVILMGDVVEHLIDPYSLINKLKKYLKKDGVIIASIPNIREFQTMKTIFFKGDFKYTNSGILDKTHLRFFTRKNSIELFKNEGYEVLKVKSSNDGREMRYLKKLRFFKLFLQLFFKELLTKQYYIVAKKEK